MADMWKELMRGNRDRYERDIAIRNRERLSPPLEKLLFGFMDDMALTSGGRIPLAAVNEKIADLVDGTGISDVQLREHILRGGQ